MFLSTDLVSDQIWCQDLFVARAAARSGLVGRVARQRDPTVRRWARIRTVAWPRTIPRIDNQQRVVNVWRSAPRAPLLPQPGSAAGGDEGEPLARFRMTKQAGRDRGLLDQTQDVASRTAMSECGSGTSTAVGRKIE